MNEQVWYYARGDVEKGPITGPQIKALAAAGKIRQDDFVWKEGMETWAPAGELKELFPGDRTSDTPQDGVALEPARKKAKSSKRLVAPASRPRDTEQLMRPVGHTSLVVGLLMVLLARGCDSLTARHVERLGAMVLASEESFEQDWQGRLRALEQETLTLQAKTNPSPAEQRQLGDLQGQLARLQGTMDEERKQLEAGSLRPQRAAARQAKTDYLLWGFWREAVFVLGTAILVVGLLAAGFSGDGPERWICLVILGAIIFSIYVGGPAFSQ